jgi:HK97 family phage major capsid protein
MKNFKEFLIEEGISEEAFKGMDFEAQFGVHDKFNDTFRAKISDLEAGSATKEEIIGVRKELFDAIQKQVESTKEILKAQGLAIKKVDRRENTSLPFIDQVKASLVSNKIKLEDLASRDKSKSKDGEFSFVVKAVGDITSANISGGNVPLEQRIAGVDGFVKREPRLLDLVTRASATSNLISWVSKASAEGAAGQTAEGAAKNQIDFNLVVSSEAVKKTTAYVKVSTEMLADVDFIASEINNELMVEVMLAVESQVYSGDGTGQNLNGVRTQATAFAPSTEFTGTVDNANNIDVLVAAVDQIEAVNQPQPSAILMHPTDVNILKATKVSATDKRYVDRLVSVAGSLELDGISIVKTTLVTKGQYLIGFFPFDTVYQQDGISIDIGLDGNDFTNNMRTILAEWRGLNLIKTNKLPAFVKGVFATDKAVLETA